MTDTNKPDMAENTVVEKLRALFQLQTIDSKADELQRLCGELPLEVQDKEDQLVGHETKINKLKDEITACENDIAKMKNEIAVAKGQIEKYKAQQNDVRNNREYDSISKEIEFQQLEIDFREKKIRDVNAQLIVKKNRLEEEKQKYDDCQKDLDRVKSELDAILESTQKEEEELKAKRKNFSEKIEPRLLNAYNRIRNGAKNGLAIVRVERDACGGCFNKIPPQRQIDVASHQKVLVCEYCGRLLIDNKLADEIAPRDVVSEDDSDE
jgi:hypothetical protein